EASASTRSCSRVRCGRTCPTRAPARCPRGSSPATTWSRPATSTSLFQRNPESRELHAQLLGHLLGRRFAYVDPQALLEPVAPAAGLALGEMRLRLSHLLVSEDMVEVRLHHLLAVRAGVLHVA